MMLVENIALALSALKTNKMRSFLTMIGIVIGIASVIAIVSVGNSLTASVTATMEDIGANRINVSVRERGDNGFGDGPRMGGASAAVPDEEDLISDETLEAFAARFRDRIAAISLSHSVGSAEAREGRLYANVRVIGVNTGYLQANNLELLAGRFIEESDLKRVRKAAVVSDRLINNMFASGTDPLGQEVKVYGSKNETYTIVGVYRHEVSVFEHSIAAEEDISTNLYIPLSLAKQGAARENHQAFIVITRPGVDAIRFTGEIEEYFAKIYAANTAWEVGVMNMESIIAEMTSVLETVSLAVAVIAAISLLVGGIGVMNIMLVSVTERTREIGTRKALGARSSYIRTQFIVEAVTICVIGGIIGIMLGLILGSIGASLLGFPATASPAVITLSVSVTILIGIFFGYYPANKAAKLDPIEALRYE